MLNFSFKNGNKILLTQFIFPSENLKLFVENVGGRNKVLLKYFDESTLFEVNFPFNFFMSSNDTSVSYIYNFYRGFLVFLSFLKTVSSGIKEFYIRNVGRGRMFKKKLELKGRMNRIEGNSANKMELQLGYHSPIFL